MELTWSEISDALKQGDRLPWVDVAMTCFNEAYLNPDQNCTDSLMSKAMAAAKGPQRMLLVHAYVDYHRRINQPDTAFDFLLGIDLYTKNDASLVRKLSELAIELEQEDELHMTLDWLRHKGYWLDVDEARYQCWKRAKQATLLKNTEQSKIWKTSNTRRIGVRLGGAITGAGVPVTSLIPPSTDSSLSDIQVMKAASSARRDLKKLLEKITKGTTPEVIATGLDTAVEQWLWLGQLDPFVLEAISFASSGNGRSLDDYLEATRWFDEGNLNGNLPRLYGYVAEQQSLAHLLQEGHQVELAAGATQPGWDLLVDGQPMQVKHTLSKSLVDTHLAKYPEIPVLVNSELAHHYTEDDRVWVDYQRIHPDTVSETIDTLSALHLGGDAGSIVFHALLACLRHTNKSKGMSDFLQRSAKDAGASVIFTKLGTYGFSALAGMATGPAGVAIAATIGAMIGNGVGDSLGKVWIDRSFAEKNTDAAEKLTNFAQWLNDEALPDKLDSLERERCRIRQWAETARHRHVPSSIVAFWESLANARSQQLNLFADKLEASLHAGEGAKVSAGWLSIREATKFKHRDLRANLQLVNNSLIKLAEF
jgi:hypothetical protein